MFGSLLRSEWGLFQKEPQMGIFKMFFVCKREAGVWSSSMNFFLLKLDLSASLMHPSLRLFTWNSRPAGAIALWSLTGAAISQKSLIWFLLDSEPGQSECGKVRRAADYNSADLSMQSGLACSHDSADGHFEKQSIHAKKCISWLLQLQYGQRKPIFISLFVSMHSLIGELTVSFPVFSPAAGVSAANNII